MDARARRVWGPLPWSQADALLVVVVTMIDLLGHLLIGQVAGGRHVTVPGFVLVAVSALPLLARQRRPLEMLAVVLVIQAMIDQFVPTTSHFGAVLTVALYSVGRYRRLWDTAAASAVTTVVVSLSQSHFHLPSWSAVFATIVAAVMVAGAGLGVARWQRELAANRQLLADRAVADERRRIARELHDIVAHHITTMQLMAGGARANLGRPEVVRDSLVTLESSGRLALREMRQLLTVLRADDDEPEHALPAPQPGAEDVQRLVDESCLAGLPTELTVDGPRQPLPPTVGLTVFRIVQEGLTNARKHAGSARADVRLAYHPDRVTVEVRDDGGGSPSPEPTGRAGYGLLGMRERVALHGGTLEAGPRPGGGFAVLAELPLTAAEAAEAAVQTGQAAR
ncbi:sensor histidine kinase [Streptomyces sp. NRRL WC-3742]|uniref:sensor histidine kinase n=1 Tax=Streptomyces sp. NRRL WC-3742 TaxID=1463934 RepID=UPI000568629E|nr:sensor histidine kinase [Streptomyces sp. NRRL WC-3742]